MKKITGFVFVFLLISSSLVTYAAPPQEDVNQLLAELGWTPEELTEYLDYYELTLDDFETADDLRVMMGTPLTDETLAQLLADYEMTRAELDELLAGFGETVDDYWFVEDLDVSIDFYKNHDTYMEEAEDFLATMGLTENEVDAFFNHLMALDETELETQMDLISARIEPYLELDPEAELSPAQVEKLGLVWSDMMTMLKINPKYYIEDVSGKRRSVSFNELLSMKTFNEAALFIELFDDQGTLLLDMRLSEEMMAHEYVLEGAEELADVGELAGELTNLKHMLPGK
ncbi:processed acidic surface protein [Bacillus salacetis]|uniref:processed acidic surface protein n=1 Tax=Bacillus salacetis TaxID=2315464 RepID=UPI003BA070B0